MLNSAAVKYHMINIVRGDAFSGRWYRTTFAGLCPVKYGNRGDGFICLICREEL